MIRDSLGKQAETDWTPEITSFKGAGQQKGPQRGYSGEERFVWQRPGRRDFKARGSQHPVSDLAGKSQEE